MFNKKPFLYNMYGIIGVIATLVSIYIAYIELNPNPISISMSILSSEKVTDVKMVPGVQANFTYKGRDVLGLWKVKVRLTNTSDRNLIGTGLKSDLLYSSIPISINNNFKVIDNNLEFDSVGIISKYNQDSNVEIYFEQWNEKESAILVIYLEQLDSKNIIPTLEIKSKSLIHGNIIITDDSNMFYTVKRKKPIFDMPKWLDSSTEIITLVTLITFLLSIVITLVFTPIDFFRFQKWKKEHSDSFNNHINSIINSIDNLDIINMLESYKSKPYKAPDWVWKNFNGQQYTETQHTDTIRQTVIVVVIYAIALLSIILQMFI
ncbi:hypothetical protein [Photobacterium iliopiscarium]|uniref:hypothetical protein n=1 Tax=Photobacterium iliopiscarium TaxID=56192 RepID=UPI0005D38BA1|nr:hypothetical protein [Photobacterium iliopiscarium]KJG13796.1 hypothetical protein UB38_06945 [Photobacterium iliopiscarium]PSU00854.1 hypothetical protein C9I85_05060 [Photobacterium iliopiscarium]PSV82060.1 hypothetical protein C9J51_12630 [Photobacterium iliopiscarium]